MSDLTLTKIRMSNRRWQGRLTRTAAGGAHPDIRVTYLDRPVEGVALTEAPEPGSWDLVVPVPEEAIADGVHTILIYDGASDSKLGAFSLIAGETVGDDLIAEVDLLRAELDMLKRAFRRHCLETM